MQASICEALLAITHQTGNARTRDQAADLTMIKTFSAPLRLDYSKLKVLYSVLGSTAKVIKHRIDIAFPPIED